jgi:DNA-binding transcriptional LysR family regulator
MGDINLTDRDDVGVPISMDVKNSLATYGVGIAVLDTALVRDDVVSGRTVRVLPDWNLSPVQVHAITETRVFPAGVRVVYRVFEGAPE